jgi:hypothetical protein
MYPIVSVEDCWDVFDELHLEWCGFSFGSGTALWANGGDCGYLYNSGGEQVSQYCYP